VRLGQGHPDRAGPEQADGLPGPGEVRSGQGALDSLGVGPHQAACAQFRAAEPPDADGDEIRDLGTLEHHQHGATGGTSGLAIVVRAGSRDGDPLSPGGAMMIRVEVALAQGALDQGPFRRIPGGMQFRQEDRGLFPEPVDGYRFQTTHGSSMGGAVIGINKPRVGAARKTRRPHHKAGSF